MPILVGGILVVLAIIAAGAGLWRGIIYYFWCDACESLSASGNVERNGTFLCRSHFYEERRNSTPPDPRGR